MTCEVMNVIKITQGSKEDILIRLKDPNTGERFDLTQFESAKAIFKTTNGVTIEKTIAWPVTDPKLGVVTFSLVSADTDQFDTEMRDFELLFVYTGAANNHIVILKDSIEVEARL